MITALCAGDYQHAAEEVVSNKRKRLSVFGLRSLTARKKKPPDRKESGSKQVATLS